MSLGTRDHATIWHPFTQMLTAGEAIPIVRGSGAHLYREDGSVLLDAVSSWWVTVHGHSHPHIADAIGKQAHVLEQVIFAGFTHPQAVQLAERLLTKLPSDMARVFFSDNGSTAVEVGLKMAWQYWQMKGEERNRIIALDHAYHGDTFGAMSVSGRSIFTKAFEPLLFEVDFVRSPGEVSLEEVLADLEKIDARGDVAAMIVEPLVQGAGGMLMYPPEVLEAMMAWCRERGILVIFDEVMTGFYRTGKLFAALHLDAQPDIMCLSKGLTGGFLPLSITTCTQEIFDAFLSEDRSRMLFHGHSFTANPLGCAAANASLDLFEQQETQDRVAQVVAIQAEGRAMLAEHPQITNLRQQGTILAMDIVTGGGTGYLNNVGKEIGKWFLERGVLMRPLGNVLYVMPPYTIEPEELRKVHRMIPEALAAVTQ